ncbi:DUF692 domain-containing protein [Burkholderia latens]|uniref:DUF692 domain-containing protein n=1 Tax=Burkholderia latens TaxID=488446 RepID=UPI00158D597B|nr:DUF692 domain-containing protein [Burkholderia latens]
METVNSLPELELGRVTRAMPPSRYLGVGVSLQRAHYSDFLVAPQPVDWLEVRTEDYLGDGGYDLHVLEQLRRDYPLSFHGVGLSIGTAGRLDSCHLDRVASLVERFQPALVSEHLSWSVVLARHLHESLPIPFTSESLEVVTQHIDQMQHAFKRTILIENVTRDVCFRQDEMTETDFLLELVTRTGCAILLDITNLYINQCDHDEDAFDALARIPADAVMEIHVGPHQTTSRSTSDRLSDRVCSDVWRLYRDTAERFSTASTLVETGGELLPIELLLDEVSTARDVTKALASRTAG